MAWVVITIAGILEIVWAVALKQSEGFTRTVPSLVTIVAMLVSFALLGFAVKSLPLGTAYAVWTGIGALGAFALGVVWFGEPLTLVRCLAAILIVSGVALLKSSSTI